MIRFLPSPLGQRVSILCRNVLLPVLLCSLFTGFLGLPTIAQESQGTRLYWQPNWTLSWEVFQGPVPVDRPSEVSCAITAGIEWKCGFSLHPIEGEQGIYLLKVPAERLVSRAYVEPLASWVVGPSDPSLQYMILIFDIHHVYSLRLRDALLATSTRVASPTAADVWLKHIAQLTQDECARVAAQCEGETAHGTLPTQLAEWRTQVDEWIEALTPSSGSDAVD